MIAVFAAAGASAQAATWTTGAPRGLEGHLFGDPGSTARAYLGPATQGAHPVLYVSEDRGRHWTVRPLPAGTFLVTAFGGPPSLLVAFELDGAVHRSIDQGRTWRRVGCCAQAIDPGDPQRLLGTDENGYARSLDGGATWQPITAPPIAGSLPTFQFDGGGVLWASTDTGSVARTVDFGTIWQVVTGVPEGGMTPVPGVAGRLWVGQWRSSDGGTTWQRVGPGDPQCFATIAPLAGAPQTLWSESCDITYRSADGGDTWQPQGPSLSTLIPSVLLDGGSTLALGPEGPWLTEPGHSPVYQGATLPPFPTGPLLADPSVPGRAFAGTFATVDSGRTWQPARRPFSFTSARVGRRLLEDAFFGSVSRPADGGDGDVSLTDEQTVLLGEPRGRRAWLITVDRVGRTDDGVHVQWLPARGLRRQSFDEESTLDNLAELEFAAGGRARTLVLEVSTDIGERLALSHDSGETFRLRPISVFPRRLAVDALDGRLILLVGEHGLYRSRDAGRRFTRVLPGITQVAVDPTRRGVWYAAGKRRVYVTLDAGATWRRLPSPPGGAIRELSTGAGRLWVLATRSISSLPLPRGPG